MALTITTSGDWNSVEGPRRKTRGTLAFDSSYLAGGESLVPRDVGLRVIEQFNARPTNGYYFQYDSTNALLKAYTSQAAGYINIDTTAVASTSGSSHLISYTLPASTLSVNGMGVRIKSWGWRNASATATALTSAFGTFWSTSTNFATSVGQSWNCDTTVIRTGASTQEFCSQTTFHSTGSVMSGNYVQSNGAAQTLASDVAIYMAASSNAGDIQQEGMIVELIVPPGTGTVGAEVVNAQSLAGLSGVQWEAIGY